MKEAAPLVRWVGMRARAPIILACAATAAATACGGVASAAPLFSSPPPLSRLADVPVGRVGVPSARASLPAGASELGPALDQVHVLVGLRLRDAAALNALITAVSDPASRSYGRYLSPQQFRARFAPSAAEVAAVEAFATAHGLSVTAVPSNRLWVELGGSAAAAQSAFAVPIEAVRTPVVAAAVVGGAQPRGAVGWRTAHLPLGTPSVPAALAGTVTAIEGLDTAHVLHPQATTSPPAFVNAAPCSQYWDQQLATTLPGAFGEAALPYAPCGYTPTQLQSAYGVDGVLAAGYNGAGVKVAIIDAYDQFTTMASDLNHWSSLHGLPAASYRDVSDPIAMNTPEGPAANPDPDGWAGEQTLDVEAVHAMAPGASIVYDGAESDLNTAFTNAQNDVVNNDRAQIVSNSYGGSSDSADANTDAVLAQAAAEGIGFYFSAGDNGDETMDPNGPGDREVDTSANNPMTTGVGGTSLAVGSSGQYLFETPWGTGKSTLSGGAWSPSPPGPWLYGGGGGTSEAYGEPSYQAGVVPGAVANYWQGNGVESSNQTDVPPFTPQIPGRAVPDVAMVGDPNTGMLVGETQDFSSAANPLALHLPTDDVHYGEYRIGGTSLSSPLFAGIMADADQAAGHAHGFANPALYAAYRAQPGSFHDVQQSPSQLGVVRVDYVNGVDATGGTTTTLRSLNQTLTLSAAPGYDDVTGLGSPSGLAFVRALAPANAALNPAPAPAAASAPAPAAPAPRASVLHNLAACKAHKLRIALAAPRHVRITRVVVQLGRSKHTLRGHALHAVTVALPLAPAKLTLTVYRSDHRVVRSTRTVSACPASARGRKSASGRKRARKPARRRKRARSRR